MLIDPAMFLAPPLEFQRIVRNGPGRRSLYTLHKKAGETAKEREWAFNGGGRIRPSMAGRTESAGRL